MAQNQVTQMLNDELDRMAARFNNELNGHDERLNALEELVQGHSSGNAEQSSDEQDELSPEKRRQIVDDMYYTQFLQPNSNGYPWVMEQNRPHMPLCRGCRHLTDLFDGEIMQYQSDEIQPRYSYSGFIMCSKLGQFGLREGPKMVCTMMEPDGGDQPDLSKRPRPKPF